MNNFYALTLTVGLAASTWAGPTNSNNQVSFDRLRTACSKDDGKGEVPSNMEISCRDTAYRYVQLDGKPMQVDTLRRVSVGISSDTIGAGSTTSEQSGTPRLEAEPLIDRISDHQVSALKELLAACVPRDSMILDLWD